MSSKNAVGIAAQKKISKERESKTKHERKSKNEKKKLFKVGRTK